MVRNTSSTGIPSYHFAKVKQKEVIFTYNLKTSELITTKEITNKKIGGLLPDNTNHLEASEQSS